jgi:hypothetical protein
MKITYPLGECKISLVSDVGSELVLKQTKEVSDAEVQRNCE